MHDIIWGLFAVIAYRMPLEIKPIPPFKLKCGGSNSAICALKKKNFIFYAI